MTTETQPDPICECSHRKSQHPKGLCRARFVAQNNRLCGCVVFWERAYPKPKEAARG